jgi:hypothetical protein
MEKVIEKLERIKYFLDKAYQFSRDEGVDNMLLQKRIVLLTEAIAELKAPPRWYTPEQWMQRTGEKWPKMAAVYAFPDLGWIAMPYWMAELNAYSYGGGYNIIICATKVGPPPRNWSLEK